MRADLDIWEHSRRLLAAVPGRWKVGVDRFAVQWNPVGSANPLRRDGRNFTDREAVEFVRSCLEHPLRGQRARHVRRRMEQLRQDPDFVALVLEISGPHGHPVLYVKWVIETGPHGPVVSFLSFHPSRRIGP
jgi:hypothetical protein